MGLEIKLSQKELQNLCIRGRIQVQTLDDKYVYLELDTERLEMRRETLVAALTEICHRMNQKDL
jgi:hypothetical protein